VTPSSIWAPQDLYVDDRLRLLREFGERSHGRTGANVDAKVRREMHYEKMLLEMAERSGEDELRVPAEVYLGLGSAHFRQSHLAEAEDAYREAVRLNPELGAAHNNLAVICMQTNRFDEARTEIAAAEGAGFPVSTQFKRDLEERARTARAKDP
jgi:tetratricopeptide (TPR) repeat protein